MEHQIKIEDAVKRIQFELKHNPKFRDKWRRDLSMGFLDAISNFPNNLDLQSKYTITRRASDAFINFFLENPRLEQALINLKEKLEWEAQQQ